MDRTMILDHLALARQHVAIGDKHIIRQRDIVSELELRGHDTLEAELLLNNSRNCRFNT